MKNRNIFNNLKEWEKNKIKKTNLVEEKKVLKDPEENIKQKIRSLEKKSTDSLVLLFIKIRKYFRFFQCCQSMAPIGIVFIILATLIMKANSFSWIYICKMSFFFLILNVIFFVLVTYLANYYLTRAEFLWEEKKVWEKIGYTKQDLNFNPLLFDIVIGKYIPF